MSADPSADSHLEIAHVLFIDIVGYSKRLIDEQSLLVKRLKELVRQSEQVRAAEAAGKLIRIPTGDGMALAFFTTPDAPVRCAIELTKAEQAEPRLELRMGIHSGPVDRVADANERANIAGAGINMAQRVMDCGDAGHILLSSRVGDDLAQYGEWQRYLHEVGEIEVKHGVRLNIVNFHADGIGNPAVPNKIKQVQQERATALQKVRRRRLILGPSVAILSLITIGGSAWFWARHSALTSADKMGTIPEKSIAVLPFENLTAEKDDTFFADGIQDDVLTSLGKIKDLTVIARTSVMIYRGAAVAGKLREIGQTLRVSHVVEGSLRRSTNRVVVDVALIDTRNDRQIWSERYERSLTDALSLQGEIAAEIAHELQATLTPREKTVVATKPTENAQAYLLYLRARELDLRYRMFDPDYETAARLYQQAVDLDPGFALARARLSIRLSTDEKEGDDATAMAKRQAKGLAEAEEAIRLRPEMGEGRLAVAVYYWQTGNPDRALVELAQAEKLLPNSAEVWQIRGSIYRQQNKIRERIAALQRAETLDPRDSNGLLTLANSLRSVRNWPEAIEARKRLQAILPAPDRGARYTTALDEFRLTGKIDSLREAAVEPLRDGETPQDCMELQYRFAMLTRDFATAGRLVREENYPHDWNAMHAALLAVAQGGDRASAERALISARQQMEKQIAASPGEYGLDMNVAIIDGFLGRKDEAIREAQRAIQSATDPLVKNDASAALALVYAWNGESDKAINLIEHLLTVPADNYLMTDYDITLAELKWRWEWDPLRSNPRFQKILAGPEPKTNY
jgi:TolB-like protein